MTLKGFSDATRIYERLLSCFIILPSKAQKEYHLLNNLSVLTAEFILFVLFK